MSWRDRPLVGFDTETTGVDPLTASVVSACVGLATRQGWSARNWLLRQAAPIPAEATAIHHITTEHANEHGQDPAEALDQIRDDLVKAWEMGMVVCGFNVVYDVTILDRELQRHGLGPLTITGPIVDPFLLDRILDPYRRGSRKLVDVARHYDVLLTDQDAHGAEADSLAACRIAWKLLGHPMFADAEPDVLAAKQAREHARKQEWFNARALGEGRPATNSTDWPIVRETKAAA